MSLLLIGLSLSLVATTFFSMNNILIGRGLRTDKLAESIFVTLFFSTSIIFVSALLSGELTLIFTLSPQTWLLFIFTGVINFVFARTFNYTGIALIGPSRNAAIVSSQILFAAFFALLFLGEPIDLLIMIGIILAFTGIILVSLSQGTRKEFASKGIIFAFLTAIFVSLAVITIRSANLINNLPIDGALISYVTASVIYLPGASLKQFKSKASFSKKNIIFLASAGLTSGIAQIARYTALGISPVVLVASIIATAPVLTMIFSFFVNKKHEIINAKLVLGTLITVIGVILVSISLKSL